MNTNKLGAKIYKLQKMLRETKSAVVAYSGGVDSSLLLYAARRVLGRDNVLAVIANSPTLPSEELNFARRFARSQDANFLIIKTNEFSDENFRLNSAKRCYYCKKELFGNCRRIAKLRGYRRVLCGANYDDKADYRPGMRAAREYKIRSPLAEVKLTKEEIRRISKALGLVTHDKPQQACLSSRIPYFEEITVEKLGRIERAERYLRRLGFAEVRVRHHEGIARIELGNGAIKKFLDNNLRIKTARRLKQLGFNWVALDMEGYRQGSMNRAIERKVQSEKRKV